MIYNKFADIDKKYDIIYADPPWEYEQAMQMWGGSQASKYPRMTLEEMCRLPVESILSENSVLFIWGVWTHNREIHDLIDAWGFDFKTLGFIWLKQYATGKDVIGMGHWTRANTEYCLLATHGNPRRINNSVSQIIKSVPKAHSQKPDIVRNKIIRLCGDVPRLEMFGRSSIHGWDTFGNDNRLDAQPLEVFQ